MYGLSVVCALRPSAARAALDLTGATFLKSGTWQPNPRIWPQQRYFARGKLVVDLISDSATIEFTSWMPGTFDSFSKKKRS